MMKKGFLYKIDIQWLLYNIDLESDDICVLVCQVIVDWERNVDDKNPPELTLFFSHFDRSWKDGLRGSWTGSTTNSFKWIYYQIWNFQTSIFRRNQTQRMKLILKWILIGVFFNEVTFKNMFVPSIMFNQYHPEYICFWLFSVKFSFFNSWLWTIIFETSLSTDM